MAVEFSRGRRHTFIRNSRWKTPGMENFVSKIRWVGISLLLAGALASLAVEPVHPTRAEGVSVPASHPETQPVSGRGSFEIAVGGKKATFQIQQDGRRITTLPEDGILRLKAAPFEIRFAGAIDSVSFSGIDSEAALKALQSSPLVTGGGDGQAFQGDFLVQKNLREQPDLFDMKHLKEALGDANQARKVDAVFKKKFGQSPICIGDILCRYYPIDEGNQCANVAKVSTIDGKPPANGTKFWFVIAIDEDLIDMWHQVGCKIIPVVIEK